MDIYQDRIRPLFENFNQTNAEIERALGIPAKTINKWNSGIVKSYQKYIPQIAAYFHVSTDYLLGNTDDPRPAGQKEKPISDQENGLSVREKRLIELFHMVPDAQQDALLQAIEISLRSQGLL